MEALGARLGSSVSRNGDRYAIILGGDRDGTVQSTRKVGLSKDFFALFLSGDRVGYSGENARFPVSAVCMLLGA
jgi:hypothetical protein